MIKYDELNTDELAALRRHAITEKHRMVQLRNGFQDDTKSYQDYMYRIEFWARIVVKLNAMLGD